MPGKLVTLTEVETKVEAEVIVSMLTAYGIYALSPHIKERLKPYRVDVVDSDLADAKALIGL